MIYYLAWAVFWVLGFGVRWFIWGRAPRALPELPAGPERLPVERGPAKAWSGSGRAPFRGAPEPNAVEWYNSDYTAKTVNDHIDISEFYLTGKTAVS